MASVRRALLSVTRRDGLADFARGLASLGVELWASEGTGAFLEAQGVAVRPLSELTGHGAMLGGRVKTLHPAVHAGILARDDQLAELEREGYLAIDLVCVNLYAFGEAARKGATVAEAVEALDVGGVTLIRAAAKNFARVAVAVRPEQYPAILTEWRERGGLSEATREQLASEAFAYTSAYDAAIYRFLSRHRGEALPGHLRVAQERVQALRYGENPHNAAAFYRDADATGTSLADCTQLHGKELSYNNLLDLDQALRIASEFAEPCAAVIKHANPSGVALGETGAQAFRRAHDADPRSAYGCVVGLNRTVDLAAAKEMKPHFVEAVLAPGYEADALELLREKKNLRLLDAGGVLRPSADPEFVRVHGGTLVQTSAWPGITAASLKTVTKRAPTQAQVRDLLFAARVCRFVKSNSIVLASENATVGIGAGQMSRVDASMLAAHKAGIRAKGACLASDAFFPFRDGVDEAAKAGVAAVIQPGGSIRDAEVVAAADEHGLAMVFSGVRLFRH
jgi:phosphoribosylaminoimidazolecarboxamide formyltransferase/IMP cyclohydrolase